MKKIINKIIYYFKGKEKVELTKEEKIHLLLREVFEDDFITNTNDILRHKALRTMAMNEPIIIYLRSLYTRIYKSAIFNETSCPSQYMLGVFAGRVITIKRLLDDMRSAKQMDEQDYIDNIKRTRERLEVFGKEAKKKSSDLIKNPA